MLVEFIESKFLEEVDGMEIDTRITLLTFSKYVFVYDWSCTFDSVVCFGGGQTFTYPDLEAMLGVMDGNNRELFNKYTVKVKEKKDKIVKRINKLKSEGDVKNPDDHLNRCRA